MINTNNIIVLYCTFCYFEEEFVVLYISLAVI